MSSKVSGRFFVRFRLKDYLPCDMWRQSKVLVLQRILEKKLECEHLLATKLPKLSAEILRLLREYERLSISEIEALTNATRNTLKVRLRELVHEGHITQSGKALATWYNLAKT